MAIVFEPVVVRTKALRRGAVLVTAVVFAVVLAASCSGGSGLLHPHTQRDTPVLLVHGYTQGECPGSDVARGLWGGVSLALIRARWAGPVLPISYYACDTDGVDITGYGPKPPTGAAATITKGQPRRHYLQDTSIDVLAHDLAWFAYDRYVQDGTAVDLVGISMGGLIIRDALYRVAAHDSRFPPRLIVDHAVTFSTPHRGYGSASSDNSLCAGTFECHQFATDSPFMAELNAKALDPQGEGGTKWTVIGSSAGCDFVPVRSSLGLASATRVDYLKPCYGHAAYLWDGGTTFDARTLVYPPGGGAPTPSATAPHSLTLLVQVLLSR